MTHDVRSRDVWSRDVWSRDVRSREMQPELDWIGKWARYAPDSVALECGDSGRQWSYSQLYRKVARLADSLSVRFEIQKGDRVACLAQNELEYVALFFATQRLGAILVPVNFRFTPSEVEHIVADCGAKVLIAQQEFWPTVQSLREMVRLWNFDGPESLMEVVATSEMTVREPVQELLAEGFRNVEFEDPCMILYTSGTTGFPKGAILSHRMLFWNSINTGLRLNLTQNEVVLTFLPLFHTGGWNVLTTPCLHRGAKIILLRKFDADRILEHCESSRVSVLFGVPTTMELLQRNEKFERTDLSSIRYAIVGGEPMALESIRVWEKRKIPIRQGYGLTEFGPNVFSLNEEDSLRKIGSIGFPNFYIEAKILDEKGQEAKADQVGELALRGPVTMSGYWRNPKATSEVMRDGWLLTGDLVRRDEEGYYYVVGRKKEMYISGAENVYPAEVEKVLRLLPGLREVAVIGVADEKWGEAGRAFVVQESNVQLSSDELREHCQKFLAKFKIPRDFVVVSDLPKTPSGKIAKRELMTWKSY